MSSSVMASLGQAAAKVGNAVKGQAQQQGKEKAGQYFQQKSRAAGSSAGSAETMPEWKLNSLCNEYGLPANVRGHLPMGGCF